MILPQTRKITGKGGNNALTSPSDTHARLPNMSNRKLTHALPDNTSFGSQTTHPHPKVAA